MTMLKSLAKVAGAAFILFGMNGVINYALMKPLQPIVFYGIVFFISGFPSRLFPMIAKGEADF